MTTDMIADMLTRIRNAAKSKHATVVVPMSKLKNEMANILLSEGFVEKVEITKNENGFSQILITLKYVNGKSVITGLKRISKPGLRTYANAADMPKVLNGLGVAIVSTSSGIITDKQARAKNVGGEVLAYIW